MKRTVLLFTGLLIGLTTVSATTLASQKTENKLDITKRYGFAQPIVFMERGIEFLVFPDGSFDFNISRNDFYSNSRRGGIDISYNGPRANMDYSVYKPNRTYVSRDRNGVIRNIGGVALNYNRYGQITRIGTIFIDYGRGRNSTLTQVGGLNVNYNRWGEIVNIKGRVNRYDDYCNMCGIHGCTINHTFNNQHRDDDRYDDKHDDGHYYYKQNGKVKKHKKHW